MRRRRAGAGAGVGGSRHRVEGEDGRCHPPPATARLASGGSASSLDWIEGSTLLAGLAVEDLVDPLVDGLGALVVVRTRGVRRTRDARDVRDRRLQVRVHLHHGRVLGHRRDGRHVGVGDRVELLHRRARHVADELDRRVDVLRVLVHGELPAADRADRLAAGAVREDGDAELADDLRRLRIGSDRIGVRPVAHERRVALDERGVGLALLVGGHVTGRGLADLGRELVEDRWRPWGCRSSPCRRRRSCRRPTTGTTRARRTSGPRTSCPGRRSRRSSNSRPCSPSWIFFAMAKSCVQVFGGAV